MFTVYFAIPFTGNFNFYRQQNHATGNAHQHDGINDAKHAAFGIYLPDRKQPVILQYLSILMPPRWFIEIVKSIMIKGSGISYIWKKT
jgi:hypothetical protein